MELPPEGREDEKAPDEPVVEEHPPAVEREEEPAPPEEEAPIGVEAEEEKSEVEELRELLLRVKADFSNYQKRVEREFASLRKQLTPPVVAPIARGFGRVVDRDYQTETLRSGVEYDAPAGARVGAVAAGVVRYAGWFRGYGRMVILDHGDSYFSVSAHLAEMQVEVGDDVERGAAIGEVGETGSLGGAKLYFEIRRGGEALDPADWLATGSAIE